MTPFFPRRLRSEVVGQYRVFNVLSHEMRFAEEASRTAYTLQCPDWASIVPLTARGEIVLVRQYRHGIDAFTLEVPGGLVDPGEEPIDAAARELREETGYVAGKLTSLGTFHPNPPLQDNRYHTFFADAVELAHETSFDAEEECEVVLAKVAEVQAMVHDGRISHALVVLSLLRAFDLLRLSGKL